MIGSTLGQYKIVEQLGEGGMGAVYRAVDEMIDREVALKMLRPELAHREEVVARFRSEAITLARLDHPNVARLYGMSKHEGQLFMVMEFEPGLTLQSIVERQGRMPWRDAAAVLDQVLDALHYAHGHNVVHRDIKPANLIVRPDGRVKVTDFGIARVLGSARSTRAGNIIGTLEYMAPEQIRGEDADGRADIYAVGAVFYELLSGRVPFSATTEYDLMRLQIEAPVPALGTLDGQAPAWCDELIATAMAKSKDTRFTTAAAFREQLRRHVAGEPEEANEPSSLVKATRLAAAFVPETRLASTAPPSTTQSPAAVAPASVTAAAPAPRRGVDFRKPAHLAAIGAAAAIVVLAAGVAMWPRAVKPSPSAVSDTAKPLVSRQPQAPAADIPTTPLPEIPSQPLPSATPSTPADGSSGGAHPGSVPPGPGPSTRGGGKGKAVPKETSGTPSAPAGSPPPAAAAPSEPAFTEFSLPVNLEMPVKLSTAISSNSNKVEDPVSGSLATDLQFGEAIVLPEGTAVSGYVKKIDKPAKLTFGTVSTKVQLQLTQMTAWSETVKVDAGLEVKSGGIGGAIKMFTIGAAAGGATGWFFGKKMAGVLIGGTAGLLMIKGNKVELKADDVVNFNLRTPLNVRVPKK